MERKKAEIIIRSIQHDIDEKETVNQYKGHYAYRDGEHLFNYEEPLEDADSIPSAEKKAVIKNLYKIKPHSLFHRKSGAVSSKMFFEKGTKYRSIYQTPFGDFALELFTRQFLCQAYSNKLAASINYDLHLNNAFVSNCTIEIEVLF